MIVKNIKNILLGLVAVLLGTLAYGGYYSYSGLARDLASTKQQLASTTANFEVRFAGLADNLSRIDSKGTSLGEGLRVEQDKSGSLAKKIDEISGTVGALDKLSKTDRELLQKYSKIYFLNENYVPTNLIKIDSRYLTKPDNPLEIHANVWSFLRQMLDMLAAEKLTVSILSAYRAFGTQAVLKSNYRLTYGAGTANQFSAEQGYSEHQLGTTVDLTTLAIGDALAGFDQSPAYQWLKRNAHKYGFTLSYPPDNGYYQFEPWHWRFVGVELATRLHNENKYFYDLDQRAIDQYLVKIFD